MLIGKPVAQQFMEEGYVVIPQLLSGKDLEKVREACEFVRAQYEEEFDRNHPGKDFFIFRHIIDPRWHKETREHLLTIMELIADPRCLGPVESICGAPSTLHSTTFFVNHRFKDVDGNWHRDFQFAAKTEEDDYRLWQEKAPQRPNGVQFQISLVDNDDLEFVPYSVRRYDSPEEKYVRLADDHVHAYDELPNAMRMRLKAGDACLINANGLHRGRYHHDNPRRTLMFTYSPAALPSRDYFTKQPWYEDKGYLDGLSPRATVYFQQFIDIYKSFWHGEVKEDVVYL